MSEKQFSKLCNTQWGQDWNELKLPTNMSMGGGCYVPSMIMAFRQQSTVEIYASYHLKSLHDWCTVDQILQ